ncbi:MAG TPA: hypothetical protein VIV40_27400 [Kofleriaceae bacterium]
MGRVTLLALVLLACGKKDDHAVASDKPAPSAPAGGAAAPPLVTSREPVGPGRVAVPGLGISVAVPKAVRFRDMSSPGKPRVAIDLGDMSVDIIPGEATSPTIDDTKAALKAAANPLDKITVERMTEGGWHLEYVALGQVDKNKLHGVDVHTTLGGTPYQCRAISRSSSEAAMYTAVCDSMQKP